ncbi:hypothetical protein COO60DRAFT_1014681 [Scenedesmus sp. NREL 46B-D3]|nr:hypothetical protein COO60DRAFT_1014681 [Scenedesmus sp. NREL 46B-D3]
MQMVSLDDETKLLCIALPLCAVCWGKVAGQLTLVSGLGGTAVTHRGHAGTHTEISVWQSCSGADVVDRTSQLSIKGGHALSVCCEKQRSYQGSFSQTEHPSCHLCSSQLQRKGICIRTQLAAYDVAVDHACCRVVVPHFPFASPVDSLQLVRVDLQHCCSHCWLACGLSTDCLATYITGRPGQYTTCCCCWQFTGH